MVEPTATFVYVPSKYIKGGTVNWKVTLHFDRGDFETEYHQGYGSLFETLGIKSMAHNLTTDELEALQYVVKHGKVGVSLPSLGILKPGRKIPTPKVLDVLYSVCCDADALNYTFDEWCSVYGYSNDSIKAKQMYDTFVQTAIRLGQLTDIKAWQAYFESVGY